MNDYTFDPKNIEICDSDISYDTSAMTCEPYFEYDNKMSSCCFTGHRNLSDKEIAYITPRLKSSISYLISRGVKEFHCGGAEGFDTLSAMAVFDVAREHEGIRLILELPYEKQKAKGDKRIYDFIKEKAHEVNIHSDNPKNREQAVKALLKRNRVLVDKSHYCVCYLVKDKGGTAYTVNYAKLHEAEIIEI